MSKDCIRIHDLLLRTIIGINEEERNQKQDVVLNITIYTDMQDACKSDLIEDAVNYKTIKKKIIKLVEGSSFFLIERLADAVAGICLAEPRTEAVTVRVDKPGALRFARSVSVEINRTKK